MENILKKSIEKNIKIEKIFVNFPDPWFKKKHHKRRVVWGSFLDNLKKWLPEETEIIFQTDQEKLFKETVEEIKKREFLEIERFKRPLWGITTYWEDRKVGEGKKIWRMKIFIKTKKNKKNFLKKIFDKIFY
jgi:tRNA (guanine-N7-)-methyltransferase